MASTDLQQHQLQHAPIQPEIPPLAGLFPLFDTAHGIICCGKPCVEQVVVSETASLGQRLLQPQRLLGTAHNRKDFDGCGKGFLGNHIGTGIGIADGQEMPLGNIELGVGLNNPGAAALDAVMVEHAGITQIVAGLILQIGGLHAARQ